MYLAAIEDEDYKADKMSFWENIYGFDMSCITPTVMAEPLVDTVLPRCMVSSPYKFFEFDINTVKKEDLDFTIQYNLKMNRVDKIHGIVCWFDTLFTHLPHEVRLSTSPRSEPTHWKQTVFYFDGSFKVVPGDEISGSIAARKSHQNFRELDIKISYHFTQFHSGR